MQIDPVPCRTDNFAYLIHEGTGGSAWIVDPSRAEPVLEALEHLGAQLRGILLTHHHQDHVEGVQALVEWAGEPSPWVAAHASDRGRIDGQTHFIEADPRRYVDSGLRIGGVVVEAMHVPGHTLGAIAWKLGEEVFTGDTLFAGGCGRIFEGTPEQLHESLQRLTAGPGERRLWFGHEYTAANLRFACAVRPDDSALRRRLDELVTPSTPTTVAQERATNLFVRAEDAGAFAALRRSKDEFRG